MISHSTRAFIGNVNLGIISCKYCLFGRIWRWWLLRPMTKLTNYVNKSKPCMIGPSQQKGGEEVVPGCVCSAGRGPTPGKCRVNVADVGPTFARRWVDLFYFPGFEWSIWRACPGGRIGGGKIRGTRSLHAVNLCALQRTVPLDIFPWSFCWFISL